MSSCWTVNVSHTSVRPPKPLTHNRDPAIVGFRFSRKPISKAHLFPRCFCDEISPRIKYSAHGWPACPAQGGVWWERRRCAAKSAGFHWESCLLPRAVWPRANYITSLRLRDSGANHSLKGGCCWCFHYSYSYCSAWQSPSHPCFPFPPSALSGLGSPLSSPLPL